MGDLRKEMMVMEVAISSLSFRRALQRDLDMAEFINLVKSRYGVDRVEISSTHVKSLLPQYIDGMTKALKGKDVDVVSMLCEAAHMYDPEQEEMETNMNMVRRWMRVGSKLGAKAMRIYSGGEIIEKRLEELAKIHAALGAEEVEEGEDTSRQKTIAGITNGFRRVSFTAQTVGMILLLENHDGPYGTPDAIIGILNEINHPCVKGCLNTAGVAPSDFRYKELMRLVPYAYIARLKTFNFDESGNETSIDMNKCIESIMEANFKGTLVVEFAGDGDEYEGVEKTVALLKQYA